ncbi:lipopolysaccharide biosynthesis protein [Rhizobium sp. SL42]|uniref:lipopolysaccharide biosynthesis protein n=1 Tax=Rhizobium sp. SL42 TaxID=2806346 RepID=UPI001F2FE0C9|nr:lipopolysaccharide biosynthesis protein [Rhizobium sp. SL42]UJW76407.1 lipopolysaccharide biosynthesis protein [Rhizobium sp. SL42]
MTGERRSYWRAVLLVFSGTAAAQIIPILGSLVIARLFIPAEFGMFMTWFGLVQIGAVLSTGRFETALPLEENGAPRAQAASSALITAAAILSAVAITGACLWPLYAPYLEDVPSTLIALFVPAVAAAASVLILQSWAASEGQFRALSMMRITQAAIITGLQIAVGFVQPSAGTLAQAHLTGVVSGALLMAWKLRPPRLAEGRRTLFNFWKRYRRFPIYALPAGTVNTAAAQLPLILISHRFGADIAGYVAMAFRMLGAPISLLGSAVLDVFKRRASESWRATGSCRGPYLETLTVLAAGSMVVTIAFYLVGVELFVFAFGPEWAEAGRVALILLPLFAMRFVSSPLSYTFFIAEKQPIDLVWQVCLFVITVVTLTTFATYRNTLAAYAVGYGLMYVVYLYLSFRFSGGRPR